MVKYSRLMLSALKGGSGKTFISLGLIASLQEKGWTVIPFKKGPDFIDAGWLSTAAGRDCFNLDPFLMEPDQILNSFYNAFSKIPLSSKVIGIIEGNRGLFDGVDSSGTYSTTELARLLKSPIILIVDCTKVTRTVAALVKGCQVFEPGINIQGVILNQIARDRHKNVVQRAIEEETGLSVIGAIPRLKGDICVERHMGLVPPQEWSNAKKFINTLKNVIRDNLDCHKIIEISSNVSSLPFKSLDEHIEREKYEEITIGVVRDSAFWFYYPENIEVFKKYGARVIEISPLSREPMPDIDFLYIGGGFPETHVEKLASSEQFKSSLREKVEKGLPVYAECGGLIYLGERIEIDGIIYPMAGILPLCFEMKKRPQGHGYTLLEVVKENPFFPVGMELRGHEFHYSRVSECIQKEIDFAFNLKKGKGIINNRDGIVYKNVVGTYTHIHAQGTPLWGIGALESAYYYRTSRLYKKISSGGIKG